MANELRARITRSLTAAGVTVGGTVETILADGQIGFSKTIPTGNNNRVTIAIDITAIKAIAIESSEDCTIYTNDQSGGTPDDTLTLTADVPLIWTENDPAAALFLTVDVTDLYITCAADAIVKLVAAVDTTPVLSP